MRISKYLRTVEDKQIEKFCPKCNSWLELNKFYNCKTGVSGKQQICIKCTKLRDLDYYNTSIGKAVSRKKTKKYYHSHKKDLFNKRYTTGASKAYNKVIRAIKSQHIPNSDIEFKRGPCIFSKLDNSNCSSGIVHFHHTNGYEHPYEGVWLCPRHHKYIDLGKIDLSCIIKGVK